MKVIIIFILTLITLLLAEQYCTFSNVEVKSTPCSKNKIFHIKENTKVQVKPLELYGCGSLWKEITSPVSGWIESSKIKNCDEEGKCDNDLDRKVLKEKNETFAADLEKCGRDCWGKSDCVHKCVVEKIGLTKDCASCFVENVKCVMTKCIRQCLTNPKSPQCKECRDANCTPDLEKCSGLKSGEIPEIKDPIIVLF